jgi:hypothetical protein
MIYMLMISAEATGWLSGENTTAQIQLEWPSNTLRHCPVAVSHTCTVLSKDAEATSSPSGENTTTLTSPEWPLARCGMRTNLHLSPRVLLLPTAPGR